jgi:LCP family protein required for cell wall assembly
VSRSAPTSAGDAPRYDEGGLRALGQRIDGAARPGRARPRKRRWLRRTLFVTAVVIVVLAGSVAGYAWYLNHEIHRISITGLTNAPVSGDEAGSENILMVGSTSRCALAVQNPAYGLCSQGVNGVNSDVIMILHANESKHQLSILSIPRDLFVPNARTDGPDKIDGALAQGPSQLVSVIENDFNIPIQHVVVLNFDTFANIINVLGGINMYFPMPVYDAYSGLDVQTTGCLHLDGYHALQVVRARHLQYKGPGVTSDNPQDWPQEAQSDLARIQRDHEFLRVLASTMAKRGLSNPVTDEQLVTSVLPQLNVDKNWPTSNMIGLLLAFHSSNIQKVPQYTLPVMVSTSEDYYYQGTDYGNIEFPSQPQDQQVIDKFLFLRSPNDSVKGGQLPSPKDVTVSVLNGTGAYNQATDAGDALQDLGFDVVGLGDANAVTQTAETYVTYSSASNQAAAQAVANSLSGAVILEEGPTANGAQVTVTTGSAFTVNPPPAAPGSTTTSSASASNGTSTGVTGSASDATASAVSQGFTTPSASQQALAPWDPRSCTASGGPGP